LRKGKEGKIKINYVEGREVTKEERREQRKKRRK
jgi:hypothetical protein